MSYSLVDCRSYGSTLSAEERASLLPSQVVKLGFDSGRQLEWMWVTVTERLSGDRYRGTLANSPMQKAGPKYGDPVLFAAWHVFDLWQEPGQA